jgi:hypothetical protein
MEKPKFLCLDLSSKKIQKILPTLGITQILICLDKSKIRKKFKKNWVWTHSIKKFKNFYPHPV